MGGSGRHESESTLASALQQVQGCGEARMALLSANCHPVTALQLQAWAPTESGRSGRGGQSGEVRAGLWGAHTVPPCQPLGDELKGRHIFWEDKLAKGPCDSLGTHRQVRQPWARGSGQVTPLPAPAPPCCLQTSSQVTEPPAPQAPQRSQ